jgi:transposase
MEVLPKDIITTWLLPHLPFSAHGRRRAAQPVEVVGAILYKLKTGCQWRWLPVRELLPTQPLTWQGVYYYFNQWRKQGTWKQLWLSVLRLNHAALDLSSVQLDGSHTPAKNGGAAVGYQGRKAARTTNTLFLADNTGRPLAVATPQAGNHHDTFALEHVFAELWELLEQAQVRLAGLFPRNRRSTDWQTADDTPLDPELYRRRLVIEQMNAWLDGFKTLLVRYETCLENWLAFHWLAFVVLLLRKIARPPTS